MAKNSRRLWFVAVLALGVVVLTTALAGCGQTPSQQSSSGSGGTIVLASKPMTEEYILADMAADLLRAKTNLTVDTSKVGMGPTEMLQPAIEKGQIDMYPEYTGTAWMAVLKQPVIHNPQELYDKVKAAYLKDFHLVWLPPLGFNDTFVLAVRPTTAARLHLKTIGDLAKYPDLRYIGDAPAFTREDEYPGLAKAYGLTIKKQNEKVVDVNFFYQALQQKLGDVVTLFSTDGLLEKYHFTLLTDNKNFFPPYQCAFVVRQATLQKYPQIATVLDELSGKINDATMRELNYKVDVEKQNPADVAQAWLKAQGLL